MKVKGRDGMITLTVTKHAVKCAGSSGSFRLFINHVQVVLSPYKRDTLVTVASMLL